MPGGVQSELAQPVTERLTSPRDVNGIGGITAVQRMVLAHGESRLPDFVVHYAANFARASSNVLKTSTMSAIPTSFSGRPVTGPSATTANATLGVASWCAAIRTLIPAEARNSTSVKFTTSAAASCSARPQYPLPIRRGQHVDGSWAGHHHYAINQLSSTAQLGVKITSSVMFNSSGMVEPHSNRRTAGAIVSLPQGCWLNLAIRIMNLLPR